MKSGVAGAIILMLVGGGLYYASTNLGDYFADRQAAGAPVLEEAASALDEAVDAIVPDDAAEETAQEAAQEIAQDAIDQAAEEAVGDVAALEVPQAAVEDTSGSAAADPADTASDTLENLANDMREEPSTTGDLPELDVIRVEPTGEVVIAGNAPVGDRVGLLYNGDMVAEAETDGGGDFVLVPNEALPSGEGTLEVVIIEEDGTLSEPGDEQVALVLPDEGTQAGFLVGVLRPGEPVEIIEREAPQTETASDGATDEATETTEVAAAEPIANTDDVAAADAAENVTDAVAADDVTAGADMAIAEAARAPFVVVDAIELEGQDIWIAGGAVPGTVVRLYQNNDLLGEALTGPEGRFLYEGELTSTQGQVRIRADALAPGSADVIARAQVPFQMPGIDPAAEVAPLSVAGAVVETDTPLAEAGEAAAQEVETAAVVPTSTERVSVLDTGNVIIRRGDNLWLLSRRVYGLGVRYTSIYDANRDQIGDPALIFPGQVFELPTPETEWGDVPGFEALEDDQIPPTSAANQ
jgi:nucleoid-associated protein YgaU